MWKINGFLNSQVEKRGNKNKEYRVDWVRGLPEAARGESHSQEHR